jgi:rsbT co-antagonist protein RsbR
MAVYLNIGQGIKMVMNKFEEFGEFEEEFKKLEKAARGIGKDLQAGTKIIESMDAVRKLVDAWRKKDAEYTIALKDAKKAIKNLRGEREISLKRETESVNIASEIGRVMEAVTSNDLTQRVDETAFSLPELRALSQAFNLAVGELEKANKELQSLVRELATPAIEVIEGVIIMPLIGKLTSDRARDAMKVILQTITEKRARVAIVDVTGVPVIDSMVSDYLIKTMKAVKLVGAEPILTGINPEIATNLVNFGVDFEASTKSTLREGISYALQIMGKVLKNKGSNEKDIS